ncbi:GGDEF domain-containing protein [Magnetococcales bacterium HHB-1]
MKIHAYLTRLQKDNTSLIDSAAHDPLTGLLNQSLFYELFHRAVLQNQRKQRPIALILLELSRVDPLHTILDKQHEKQVAKEITQRLRKQLRQEDMIGRMDRLLFAVFLPECGSKNTLRAIISRMKRALTQVPFRVDDQIYLLECSVGSSFFPDDEKKEEKLIQFAKNDLEKNRSKDMAKERATL